MTKTVLGVLLLISFSIIIQHAYAHDYSVTLKPGEERILYTDSNPWSTEADSVFHVWTDASGDAASWVTPTHLDFGEVIPGEHYELPYTIRVPSEQELGNYILIWTNNCTARIGTCNTSTTHTVFITIKSEEPSSKPQLIPSSEFEFDIETPAFTTVIQGDQVSVQVTISHIQGEREQVALSATSWSNLGITTWFDDNPVLPSQTTSFFIKTTCGTPPDNYYFDILGTSESAATSIDSVTVTVKPNSACSNVQPTQTTKYLPYENNQYGFSLKYPSTWQKNEILERDEDKPNRITIATFTSPSQTGYYIVGFAENDPTYKGLNDQQFLNKMKKEIANDDCQECQDIEFLSTDTATHKNGYKLYYAVLTATIPSDDGTLNPLLTYALIPDGNDLWLIALMLFSSDDSEQLLDEITPMGESFTSCSESSDEKSIRAI